MPTKEFLTKTIIDLESKNRKLVGGYMHIHSSPTLNEKQIREFVKGELISFLEENILSTPQKPKRTRKLKILEEA